MRRWLACAVVLAGCDEIDVVVPLRVGTPCPAVVMREVNDHFIATHPDLLGTYPERAVYFIGDVEAARTLGEPRYIAYARAWAERNQYELNGVSNYDIATGDDDDDGELGGARNVKTRNPDNHAAGQVYLDLYELDRDLSQSAEIAKTLDYITRNRGRNDWGWAEAQFMASPAFAHLGALTGQQRYFDTMFQLFLYARDIWDLFDDSAGLWVRDIHFHFPQHTTDRGAPVFWSRANGYVIASIARTLPFLPADSPYRPTYERMFRTMAAALAPLQRYDGLWNVSLADLHDHPGPEESGSALITFALAWGINNGLLDRATYLPVVEKAWRGIVAITVRFDLEIGFVQGFAKGPDDAQPITLRSTGEDGVGAFLLAGSEVQRLGLDLECP